ncbi:PP2C family protein-serine/threonine phosphatase [Marinobacter fonticola]|uniref:PP2C family protein-serine/threonine phosphatase n=1 Tax=Marinobacter fonticola TaxID=2603215 RepID=UPI0011E7953D|nr:fused response regulator/phosphatase [Marinobacter fonticola]
MGSRTERILIIDPDAVAAKELERLLEARSFYVSIHDDLESAAGLFEDTLPDAIFADIPPDAIHKLAHQLDLEDAFVPIVACHAASEAQEVVAALRCGAADVLIKPYRDTSAIDDVLEKLSDRVRISRLNQIYRQELEDANRDLRAGIAELRADQNAGRKVQLKMLPDRHYESSWLAIEHLIKPSLYLSGDFLDYFRLDDNRTLVYIADVSGHGASSAFVTVLLKNLTNRLQRNIRRGSSDDILYPDRFLERINSELLDTGLGKHLTVFAGIIDHDERKLTYAVGAHFPMPILADGHGNCRFLEGTGLPIGLFESPEWDIYETSLEGSFRLILFSDGILEVIKAKNLDEKEQRLLELVSAGRHTIAALSEALNLDEITELPDDIAIVTVTDILPSRDVPSDELAQPDIANQVAAN